MIDDCHKTAVGKYQLCRQHQSSVADVDMHKYLNNDDEDRSIASFSATNDFAL
jgi:hypothetical protein